MTFVGVGNNCGLLEIVQCTTAIGEGCVVSWAADRILASEMESFL
jgi:hypothetical protein